MLWGVLHDHAGLAGSRARQRGEDGPVRQGLHIVGRADAGVEEVDQQGDAHAEAKPMAAPSAMLLRRLGLMGSPGIVGGTRAVT